MGSNQLTAIHNILQGTEKEQGKGNIQVTESEGMAGEKSNGQPSRLNQLSDAAEKVGVKPGNAATTVGLGTQPTAQSYPTQPQDPAIEVPQQLAGYHPTGSQPEIPPAVLPDGSQPLSQQQVAAVLGSEEAKHLLQTTAALGMPDHSSILSLLPPGLAAPMALNMDTLGLSGYPYAALTGLTSPDEDGTGGTGGRQKGKKPTRRGPMDEMRQLIRILVKVFPQSIALVGGSDEAGGGNRISEEQIKSYLEKLLGDAPRPSWGVPNGWNGYLAELFSWATGKVVTGEEAKGVAKREPGRSWEAMESELEAIGVHPHCWPLPLTLAGVQEGEQKLTPQPIPIVPTVKRSAEEAGIGTGPGPGTGNGNGGGGGGSAAAGGGGGGSTSTKRTRMMTERDLNKLEESDLWKLILEALNVASTKLNSGVDQSTIMSQKLGAKAKIDEITTATLNSMYLFPGMPGADAILSAMQVTMPPGIPGFDPSDPNTAAAFAAAVAAANAATDTKVEGNAHKGKSAKRDGEVEEGSVPPAGTSPAGEEGQTDTGAQKSAGLPIQPPLNVGNFNLAAYMSQMAIPNLNLGALGTLPLQNNVASAGGDVNTAANANVNASEGNA